MTLKSNLKELINLILESADIGVERQTLINRLKKNEDIITNYGLLKHIKKNKNKFKYIENLSFSKSQIRQDLFVLNELDFKNNGFFIEFGAANGIDNSNTFILENKFGWDGLLAEPAKIYHQNLAINRKCKIEKKCIWNESKKKLNF